MQIRLVVTELRATHLARSRQALERPATGQTEKGVLIFSDDFPKLQNAAINFVMFAPLCVSLTAYTPVCPSARSNSAPVFIKLDVCCFIENLPPKILVLLK